jgi:hypothetical protein
MITETQSCALDIRDAFYNVVSIDPFFTGFVKRKSKMLPVQQHLVPYLGIYLGPETMLPAGDANHGCVRFKHTARICFSVVVANSNPDLAERTADQAYLKIMSAAYTNIKLMNVLHNLNPEGVGIEAVVRGDRRMIYGAPSTDNELPFVELEYEATCSYETEWYPDITDTLDTMDVIVKPNNSETADPIHVSYDLKSDTTPPIISGEAVRDTTSSSVTIKWTTDEPATSQIEYGLTAEYGSMTTIDPALVTAHSVLVSGLASRTTYFSRVRTKDAAGNEAIGAKNIWLTI